MASMNGSEARNFWSSGLGSIGDTMMTLIVTTAAAVPEIANALGDKIRVGSRY